MKGKRGRPKGSKNKAQKIPYNLNEKAKKFSELFIGSEGIDSAEILAVRILEKIRASKARLIEKYGEK